MLFACDTSMPAARNMKLKRRMVEQKEIEMQAPTPHERLTLARKRWQARRGLSGRAASASEAANTLEIPKGTYLGLENGTRSIIWDRAVELASRFRLEGVTPEWILSGRGTVLTHPVKKMSQSIAIVYASDTSAFSAVFCGKYLESERQIVLEQRAGGAHSKKERRLVGIETEDDAMAREKMPSYSAGSIIMFDLDQTPRPGMLVWAHIASRKESVIREYTRAMSATGGSNGVVVLKAYNQAYESIPFDAAAGDKIAGVYDPHAPKLAVYMQA